MVKNKAGGRSMSRGNYEKQVSLADSMHIQWNHVLAYMNGSMEGHSVETSLRTC